MYSGSDGSGGGTYELMMVLAQETICWDSTTGNDVHLGSSWQPAVSVLKRTLCTSVVLSAAVVSGQTLDYRASF